ncbi:hypothetical protein GCM10010964_00130 [Caldovatus sediminis]|uniref:Transposase DDE domain-containing protein n=1 Tax=Caldovatus sediminis TaxID=2041189 RepID=A0A8J2Z7Y9_9PROT|nr:transposase [Caldovatus sediminis]GGG15805.1 hypothetical protein GCM10010964_00130 [Caldovatus sediminis]
MLRPCAPPVGGLAALGNAALAPARAQVERPLGARKRSYGWRRVRYRGLLRNGAHLPLLCATMNLRRAERLRA